MVPVRSGSAPLARSLGDGWLGFYRLLLLLDSVPLALASRY